MKNRLFSLIALSILLSGCDGVPKIKTLFESRTDRDRYASGIDSPEASRRFEKSYQIALSDSLSVTLPYGEKGIFGTSGEARSYLFGLQEGESVFVKVASEKPERTVFLELLRETTSGFQPIADSKTGELSAAGETSGIFKLIIQPENGSASDFFLSIEKRPIYTFPVAGKTSSAIQSFWGQPRDGGARSHEGIDIFAKRGTPVVAVTNGTINYTGERGIGGKQVWLRAGLFGKSIYYAHLDEIKTESGKSVSAGDTLGFVGNTGNAKGGSPHLHFGVYGNSGAVDPLPFVRGHEKISEKMFPRKFAADSLSVTGTANLRKSPDKAASMLTTAVKGQKLQLLGQSKEWLHVRTSWGKSAFIHQSLVKKES